MRTKNAQNENPIIFAAALKLQASRFSRSVLDAVADSRSSLARLDGTVTLHSSFHGNGKEFFLYLTPLLVFSACTMLLELVGI